MGQSYDRVLGVAAGLSGAAGVALSAAGAHAASGSSGLGVAGTMLLIHAAALLALAGPSVGSARVRRLAGTVMFIGVVLFSGDLAARTLLGHRLFPLAAPLGGFTMIAAWIAAALSFAGHGRNG